MFTKYKLGAQTSRPHLSTGCADVSSASFNWVRGRLVRIIKERTGRPRTQYRKSAYLIRRFLHVFQKILHF